MVFKKYINNADGSKISAIYTDFSPSKPSFFIKYNDGTYSAHKIGQIVDFLNKNVVNPLLAISPEIKEDIVNNSEGILYKDDNTAKYEANSERVKALYFSKEENQRFLTDEENQILSTKVTRIPWYEFQDNFSSIVAAANQMLSENPEARIFSLGQSPAWIIKAAEKICKINNVAHDFGYIPFSGSFYDEDCDENNEDEYGENVNKNPKFIPRSYKPVLEQVNLYHDLLRQLNFDPETIINEYQKNNVKTVLVEFINSGSGLASFLSILFSAAQKSNLSNDDLIKALEVLLFVTGSSDAVESIEFDGIRIECKYQVVEEIWDLANGPDQGGRSDRLVPRYPFYEWNEKPKQIENNKNFISSLDQILQSVCDKQELLQTHETEDYSLFTCADEFSNQNINDTEVSVAGHLENEDLI